MRGVVTFQVFTYVLLLSFGTCLGAFIGTSGGSNKDDGNEIQGGYGLRQPDLPALYSAPKSHQEQDAQDNDVDQASTDSTTTEIYFEDREDEEDTSEDYPGGYTTLATQNPRDVPTPEYGAPLEKSHSNSGYSNGPQQTRRMDKIQNYNNKLNNSSSRQAESTSNPKPLDQQQIENHQFPQHAYLPPPSSHHEGQEHSLASQYGSPNSEQFRVQDETHGFNPKEQNNYRKQYSQNNELQSDFQPAQYLPPQSQGYSKAERHNVREEPQSINEQRYATDQDVGSGAGREYGTPASFNSHGGIPSHYPSQKQVFPPQGGNDDRRQDNYQQQQQIPRGNHHQQELHTLPQQQQRNLPQQQQPFPQHQQNIPQHQQNVPQQQQNFPQHQQNFPQQQQNFPDQQQNLQQQQPHFPEPQYLPQQREPLPQQLQQQQQSQGPQPQQINQQPQQYQGPIPQEINQQFPGPQQPFYSLPSQTPQEPIRKSQSDSQYLPPTSQGFQQSPFPNEEKSLQPQPEFRGGSNGIQSSNDIFEFDGFHDNDNVVDAELLQRVQQIIEEHERQQKEIQEKFRQANEANEAFFQTTQNHIQASRNEFFNEITTQNQASYLSNDNNPTLPNFPAHSQGFYQTPTNNSIGMFNDIEKQRSIQIYPQPLSPESINDPSAKFPEMKNLNNVPYGPPQSSSFPSKNFNSNENPHSQIYPSSLSPNEPSRQQFSPESQIQEEYREEIYPDGINGISNERQYESQSYNNQPNQLQWSNPTPTNSNSPQNNAYPRESGQRSNESPSKIESSAGKPPIEYQKAILTEHFVETKPEFPPREGDPSRRELSPETPSLQLHSHARSSTFRQHLTSQFQQFQNNQNPSIYNNQGTNQDPNEKTLSAYPQNQLDNHSNEPNLYSNPQTYSQAQTPQFYQPQIQNSHGNPNGEHFQYPFSYPPPPQQNIPTNFNTIQDTRNEGENSQGSRLSQYSPNDPSQFPSQPSSFPTSYSSIDNSRTIVVHEVPYGSMPGISNRAVINEQSSSPALSTNEEAQQNSADKSFENPRQEINFYSNNLLPYQEQPQQQQQQQSSPSNLPYDSQLEKDQGKYLPPADPSSNMALLNSNEIGTFSPKPIYGIPLAPVVDPDSVIAIDQRDSSLVLSSQISFGENPSVSNGEALRINPHENINILPYSTISNAQGQQFYGPPQLQQQQYNVPQQQQQQQTNQQPQQQVHQEEAEVPNEYYPQQLILQGQQNENNEQHQQQQQPEIHSQYTKLARQGSWQGDVVSAVSDLSLQTPYGLPQSGAPSSQQSQVTYGISNHTASPYNVNDGGAVLSTSVSNSVSQSGYVQYPRRNRSLKKKNFSTTPSTLVTSFTVKSKAPK